MQIYLLTLGYKVLMCVLVLFLKYNIKFDFMNYVTNLTNI
jgi:hypothetical protein